MRLLKQPTKMFEADCVTTVSPAGDRISTVVVMMPRFILAEITRHKSFSFSVASSRAIPTKRCIESVRTAGWTPTFRANQAGMSPGDVLSGPVPGRDGLPTIDRQNAAAAVWNQAKDSAVGFAYQLDELGVHKQWVNRLLEPFAPVTVVMTATHRQMVPAGDSWLKFKPWKNLFRLRISEYAQDEIRATAEAIQSAMQSTKWVHDDYHDPAFYDYPRDELNGVSADFTSSWSRRRELCAAQMARVSYARNDIARPAPEDLELARRLRADWHMSPFEHVAVAAKDEQWGPLWGWRSERMRIESGYDGELDSDGDL